MKFSALLQTVQLRPRFLRPQQAAMVLGSGEVIGDFVEAGWLHPVVSEHRLVLYSLTALEKCVERLENGEPLVPDGITKRPRTTDQSGQQAPVRKASARFRDQLRDMISITPLLLRPEQAAVYLGSVELLDELRKSRWIQSVYSKHLLTLYSIRHLDRCAIALEAGRLPGEYADEHETPLTPYIALAAAEPRQAVIPAPRKTRRPMPDRIYPPATGFEIV